MRWMRACRAPTPKTCMRLNARQCLSMSTRAIKVKGWLVLGLCFGIASLFEIEGPLMHSLKYGLIVFSIYKVLHGFLVEAVRPKGWGSPLLTLPPPLAWHGYLTLHTILLYSAIFITIIGVLGSFGPRSQEILWRVYSLSVLALFIWFVAPKSVFLALLSSPSEEVVSAPSLRSRAGSGGPDVKKVAPDRKS